MTPSPPEVDLKKLVDDDLRRIVMLALDLTYYRRTPVAGDLSRATARELLDAVKALPDHTRDA